MKGSRYISQPSFTDTAMIFKFVRKNNEFIHTFFDGELLYKLGFTPEGIIGKTLYDLHRDDIDTVNLLNTYYEKAWKGQNIEYEGKFKGIHYVTYLRPFFHEKKVAEVVGTCVDITKRKNMEEDICQKENLYRAVLETMSEAVLIETGGEVMPLNEKVEKALGVKKGYFTDASMAELDKIYIKEDGSPIPYQELLGVITQRKSIPVENFVLGVKEKNSDTKWLSVNSKPLKFPGKGKQASLVTLSDITFQKEQERKILNSYAFQRSLIDQLDSGVVVTDCNKRIRLLNKKFYDIFQLEGGIDWYIGQHAPDLYDLFDKEINEEAIESIGKQSRTMKEIEMNSDTTLRYNCFPFNGENGFTGYMWEFEDITEQKKMERAIIHAKEEAEKANMAKSDFLSKMSHELRTPLNGILGFAQLLELEKTLNEQQRDFVQEILSGGGHLLNLINEILDLSRIETGKLKVSVEEVHLLTVINECIKIVQPLAKKKKISIHKHLDQCQNTFVLADPFRLKQILLNLLDNAIKYNREHGKVNIFCHLEGNELAVHIVDTGVGLSVDEYAKVFVPFYRIEETKEEGTGIGLSLVKQLVQLMGGKISVLSHKGKGSDFCFSLPIPDDLKAVMRWGEQVEPPVSNGGKGDNYRLLFIEDNESNLHLVRNIIKSQPSYTLLSARSGKKGLEIAAKEKVDLILLDINLPDIHGYDVFDILKKSEQTKDIATIAVSANAMPQDIQDTLDKGFDNYVTKPLNVKEFLTVVSETLNNTIIQKIPDYKILSTGPYGEEAVSAKTLRLTLDELKRMKEKKYKAAIAMHYATSDWSRSQVEGVKATFGKMGIEVVAVTNAEFKWEKQVADIETILAQKPDVLVSIPVDPVLTASTYQKAAQAGVKLVFMDNIPKGLQHLKDYVSVVSADNYGNGVESAHIMAEKLDGKGKIGVIYHDADFFATKQRTEAFEKTIRENYPDIQIVDSGGIVDPNDGEKVASAMIAEHQDLDGIFVVWDVPAEGALAAARAAGRINLVITTIDLGVNVALEIAQGGLIKGLGAQLPYQQGVAEAILAGYALLGKQAPPYVAVPALRVTRENILDAWKLVYNQVAPNIIQSAAKYGNANGEKVDD